MKEIIENILSVGETEKAEFKSSFNSGMIEKYRTGIKRVIASIKDADLPAPYFKEIADGIQVTIFFKQIVDKNEKTVEKILTLIKTNPEVTQKELSEATGLTQRGIEWNLKKMKDEEIIDQIGPDEGGKWIVT